MKKHTVKSVLPFRKKMNNDLSKEEKIYNKKQSQLRIIAEHTILQNLEVWNNGQ